MHFLKGCCFFAQSIYLNLQNLIISANLNEIFTNLTKFSNLEKKEVNGVAF